MTEDISTADFQSEGAVPKGAAPKVVLSGIRATGRLHLGNLLGPMRHFVTLSRSPEHLCYFFVADLHSLTTLPEPGLLARYVPEIVLDYLAAGIDPNDNVIYAQSSVGETCELAVLLSNLMILSHLQRCATFKEKARQQPHNVNAGLFYYPVLMAADILGPGADLVPVGEDQLQHVEMARDLARRYNAQYGTAAGARLVVPETLERAAVRIPGLDGGSKMGKSDGNTLNLNDDSEVAWEKLRVAVTDTNRKRRKDPGDPTKCNIFTLHTYLSSDDEVREVAQGCRSAAIGCFDCKKVLHANLMAELTPFQERRAELASQESLVSDVLCDGARRVRPVIADSTARVRAAMGIESRLSCRTK